MKDMYDLNNKNDNDEIETLVGKNAVEKLLRRISKDEKSKDNNSFGCCPKKHYDFWIKLKRFFSLKYHRSQKENKRNHKEKGELKKLNVEYATKKDMQKLGRHGNGSSMNYVKTKSGAVVVVPGLNPQAIAKKYKGGVIMEAAIKE